ELVHNLALEYSVRLLAEADGTEEKQDQDAPQNNGGRTRIPLLVRRGMCARLNNVAPENSCIMTFKRSQNDLLPLNRISYLRVAQRSHFLLALPDVHRLHVRSESGM